MWEKYKVSFVLDDCPKRDGFFIDFKHKLRSAENGYCVSGKVLFLFMLT